MVAKYTGLIFAVPSTVDIQKFRYDLVIQYKSGEATYQRTTGTKTKRYIDQKFNNQGKTIERQLPKGDIQKINYHIKVNGQLVKNISAKPNKSKGVFRKYELKTTIAGTRKDPNTIKKVLLDTTEVAWYLVKKQESIKSFLNRIYIYTPTSKEENIFRSNNPHLTGTPVLTLQPGDVVVLSNTSNSNNKELAKMKKEAREAKLEFDKVKEDYEFDDESFAYNADVLQGMLMQADYVALTKDPIKTLDKPSGNINLAAVAAGTSQGIVTFYEHSNELVQKNYAKIYKALEYEKSKGSKLANPKNYKLFRKKYAKLFKNYDHAFSQKFFKLETGIQTNNLRRQINKDVFARSKNYKGGIPAYTDNLKNMGKISRFTYLGGNVLIGVGAAQAYINIEDARKTGDSDHITKTAITETLKFGGNIGGGYYGSVAGAAIFAVAFGVTTGGLGFVVLGAGAVIGGTVGGLAGGEIGDEIADLINKRI
ncbi:hypothetical protein [uncultured Psychrobacter sp.]|uniref:hypothetical protein n=1 Tax=uncultured Psychrobacter sp. TaxID=259303 RepID=UPI0034596B74